MVFIDRIDDMITTSAPYGGRHMYCTNIENVVTKKLKNNNQFEVKHVQRNSLKDAMRGRGKGCSRAIFHRLSVARSVTNDVPCDCAAEICFNPRQVPAIRKATVERPKYTPPILPIPCTQLSVIDGLRSTNTPRGITPAVSASRSAPLLS
jgi:hypothetical protein